MQEEAEENKKIGNSKSQVSTAGEFGSRVGHGAWGCDIAIKLNPVLGSMPWSLADSGDFRGFEEIVQCLC